MIFLRLIIQTFKKLTMACFMTNRVLSLPESRQLNFMNTDCKSSVGEVQCTVSTVEQYCVSPAVVSSGADHVSVVVGEADVGHARRVAEVALVFGLTT